VTLASASWLSSCENQSAGSLLQNGGTRTVTRSTSGLRSAGASVCTEAVDSPLLGMVRNPGVKSW
jgi:hypothetical protein